MAHRRKSTLVSSEADLIAQIGYNGPSAIEDWLTDQCEFADGFDDDGGDESFRRVVFMVGNFVSAHYTIDLPYPFDFSDLEEEADRAELYFRCVIHASGLDEADATLGNPGSEDDQTEAFANEILGGTEVEDLVAVLGGKWRQIELDVSQGASGERIYAWFVPCDDRPVALGIGAGDLFVVPLLGSAPDGYWVEEWPVPTVGLWWTGEWKTGVPQGDPADSIQQLKSALASYAGTAPGSIPQGPA